MKTNKEIHSLTHKHHKQMFKEYQQSNERVNSAYLAIEKHTCMLISLSVIIPEALFTVTHTYAYIHIHACMCISSMFTGFIIC